MVLLFCCFIVLYNVGVPGPRASVGRNAPCHCYTCLRLLRFLPLPVTACGCYCLQLLLLGPRNAPATLLGAATVSVLGPNFKFPVFEFLKSLENFEKVF